MKQEEENCKKIIKSKFLIRKYKFFFVKLYQDSRSTIMDRMDFINNRIDPCARQPYRIALKDKGFAPGCKLLVKYYVLLELLNNV